MHCWWILCFFMASAVSGDPLCTSPAMLQRGLRPATSRDDDLEASHLPESPGPLRCGQAQFPEHVQQEAASGVELSDAPSNVLVDVNVGTNLSPMPVYGGHYTILVDPLPTVCNSLIAKFASDPGVCFLCFAVANYSGTAELKIYNGKKKGVSASLSSVSKGTSHEGFASNVVLQPVFVMRALPIISEVISKNVAIERLKLDMQGHDLSVLRDIYPILAEEGLAKVHHIKAECFYPNSAGKQIYEVDNSCQSAVQYLQSLGYTAKLERSTDEWGDVYAYKAPATDYLPESAWFSEGDLVSPLTPQQPNNQAK